MGRAPLVVQWLRVHAPESGGVWVASLVRKIDPACHN